MSRVAHAIAKANREGRLALAAFLTAGFPDKQTFADTMPKVAAGVDLLEIGVPFSDPMADGVSIQHASHEALRHGVALPWIFEMADAHRTAAPVVFMSYLNPLLAFGLEKLAAVAARTGVAGFIVPDLPYEEARPVHEALQEQGLDLIRLVTPTTPLDRLKMICRASSGFVYAVTMTGTTGGALSQSREMIDYLDRVRSLAPCPVMAGFGIREPEHVAAFVGHADGVIVGSALMDMLRQRLDPEPFVRALRKATYVGNEVVK